MRAITAVVGVPWAILPETLTTILEIANRENLDIAAVEAQLGRKLDNTHTVTVRDGVATIPIEGPIFRRADFFADISGATSIETLAQDLHAALDDHTVQSIILAIDSPGGSVNGVGEFADMVYAARGVKPITAYVSHQGASAAYWIASAASEVVVAPTALVGSIGVVAAVPDPSKTKAKEIEFVSSQSPKKRPDPTTQAGSAQLQATVDDIADLFIAAVAHYRGVSVDTVLADFGAGDVLMGQKAVDAGLADRVGSYEGVVAAARAAAQKGPWPRVRSTTGAQGTARLVATGDKHVAVVDKPAGSETAKIEAKRRTAMPLNWKFWEKTDATERAELRARGVEGVPEESEISAIDAEVERRLSVERERDREALRVERTKRLEAEAGHHADELIRAGRLTPVERENFIGFRADAAMLDAINPTPRADGKSRVEAFDAIYDVRPPHGLFGERINPGAGKAQRLDNPTSGGDPKDVTTPAGAAASATEWGKKQNAAQGAKS